VPYKCRHTIVYLMTWKPTFETDEGNQREVVSAEYWSRRRDLNPRPADYEEDHNEHGSAQLVTTACLVWWLQPTY